MKTNTIRTWILAIVLIGTAFASSLSTQAADTILNASYQDANNDAQVDSILWELDETITACAYEASDWAITNPGTINANSISNISCTGTDSFLSISISANANITGGSTNPVISYTDQGTLGSVVLSSGSLSNKTQSIADGAAPRALSTIINYNDNVSSMVTTFTEAINTNAIVTSAFHLSNISGSKDVTLTIASNSPNGTTITHSLSEYQRADAQEISGVPGGDGGAVVLDIDSNGFQDLSGNSSTSNSNIPATEIPDTTPPQLLSWEINLKNPEQIMLDFSETIASSTLDATSMTLFGISRISAAGIVLQPGFLNIADLDWALVNLAPADIERIKDDTSVATESGNSYLSISSNLIQDLAGNQVIAISPANALLASKFTRRSSGRFRRSKYKKENNAMEPDRNVTGAICGDNIRDVSETCDDGNFINGDGCSDSCQREIYDQPIFPLSNSESFSFNKSNPIPRSTLTPLQPQNRDDQIAMGERISTALGILIRGLKQQEKLVEQGSYSSLDRNLSIINPHLNLLKSGPQTLPEPSLERSNNTIKIDFGASQMTFLRPVLISVDTGIPDTSNILNSISITDAQGQSIQSIRPDPSNSRKIIFATNILRPLTLEIQTRAVRGSQFPDISNDQESAAITALSELGIISGFPDKTFKPLESLTKAQVAKIIALSIGLEPERTWPDDLWYSGYARALEQAEIITFFFNPLEFQSKGELLQLIASAKALPESSLLAGQQYFSDIPLNHPLSKIISHAVIKGWITERSGEFKPNDIVTRSTAAGWIYRALIK